MKTNLITATLAFLFLIQISSAQRTGLLFNDEAYKKVPLVDKATLGWTATDLPSSTSLKSYAPIPGNQGDYGTCVGWSTAYAALTIVHAKKYKLTDKEQITASAFCPYYLYDQFKGEYDLFCQTGGFFEDALDVLYKKGAKKYYLPEFSCYSSATSHPDEIAKNFRIDNYFRLFDFEQTQNTETGYLVEKITNVKSALADGNPVLFGMFVPNSFINLLGDDNWTPTYSEKLNYNQQAGHAMVIVGYDNYKYGGAFQIMNSWGTEWGKDGFAWIKYDDFKKFVHTAFYFEIDNSYTPSSGCLLGDCSNSYSRYKWPNGETYEGEMVDGYLTGSGIYYWNNGEVHVGEWKNGKRHGEGISTSAYGYITRGFWKDDVYVGKEEPDYTDYTTIVETKEEEEKKETEEEKEVETDWNSIFNDIIDGETEIKDDIANGCISGDCDNGYGKFIYSDGDIYEGYFKSSYRNGFGKYQYIEGDVYTGEWSWNTRSGLGHYVWPSGNIYIGYWKNNSQHGKGTKFHKDGTTNAGEWENGTFKDPNNTFGFAGNKKDIEKTQNSYSRGIHMPEAEEYKSNVKASPILKQNGFGIPKGGLEQKMNSDYNTVKRVVTHILKASGRSDLRNPPIKIIDDPNEVAFIHPKTGINVSHKFLEVCKSFGKDAETALAFVLAHELGHYINDHFFSFEYGSAYASTEWGQQMKKAYMPIKDMGYYESQADEFGLFVSYTAGYNTLEIGPQVIDRIYEAFSLPEELPGYPPKSFRKDQIEIAKKKVQDLIPVFEAGNILSLLSGAAIGNEKMEVTKAAISCYDHIIQSKITTAEMYNNIGINYLHMALTEKADEIKLAFPIEIDFKSRLYIKSVTGSGKGPGDPDLGWGDDEDTEEPDPDALFKEYLYQAEAFLDKALSIDKNYLPANNNKVIVAILSQDLDEAEYLAKKAAKKAKQFQSKIDERNAHDLLYIIYMLNDDTETALKYYNLATAMNSPYTVFNEKKIKNPKYNPQSEIDNSNAQGLADVKFAVDPRDYQRPFDNDQEKINGMTLWDITNQYIYDGKDIQTWNVGNDNKAQIGKDIIDDGELVIFLRLDRGQFNGAYSFYQVDNTFTGNTMKDIKVGNNSEQVVTAYNNPHHVVSSTQHDYWVYIKNNIIFKIDQKDQVDGWIYYDIN